MSLLLAVLWTGAAVSGGLEFGKHHHFLLGADSDEVETFHSVQPADKLSDHEVLKVHLYPTGKKNARPSAQAPVWLWVTDGSERHSWVLPWRPGGGYSQQWLEVLLCHNRPSLRLRASTNSTQPLPMRWRVSTENVVLADGGTMKSTPADISYRRYTWQVDDVAAAPVEMELRVQTIASCDPTCASLVVSRACVTQPHELTDEYALQRIAFFQHARLTVARADAPDGFWVYLIPELDGRLCGLTSSASRDGRAPPPAKLVRVFVLERAFRSGAGRPPTADGGVLPVGSNVRGVGVDGDWADAPPTGTCSERISRLDEQLMQARQQCRT